MHNAPKENVRSARFAASTPPVAGDLASQIMVADYLDPVICRKLVETLVPRNDGFQYGQVLTDANENKTELMLEVRRTEQMITTDQPFVDGVLRDIVVDQVEPFFHTTMDFWNSPVLLRYSAGGFFLAHVDGEQYKDGSWSRIYDRDYTLVVFLNEDYEGGELSFPDQNVLVKPKSGRVVAFPADHRFRHGAEKTLSGLRYQLVSWLTAQGTVRTRTPPNPSIIYRTGDYGSF